MSETKNLTVIVFSLIVGFILGKLAEKLTDGNEEKGENSNEDKEVGPLRAESELTRNSEARIRPLVNVE